MWKFHKWEKLNIQNVPALCMAAYQGNKVDKIKRLLWNTSYQIKKYLRQGDEIASKTGYLLKIVVDINNNLFWKLKNIQNVQQLHFFKYLTTLKRCEILGTILNTSIINLKIAYWFWYWQELVLILIKRDELHPVMENLMIRTISR